MITATQIAVATVNHLHLDVVQISLCRFLDIASTVEMVLDSLGTPPADTLDDVIALDAAARRSAERYAAARAA